MKLFKNKRGSQLVEKIMMTAFSVAAGAAVIVYGVNVINASKTQNIDLNNYQGVTIDAEHGTDGILYTLNGSTYDVTGYEGSASVVNIPLEYNNKKVTRIKYYAFSNNDNISEVNISNGITEIECEAFINLPNLRSISLPGTMSMANYRFIGNCPGIDTIRIAEGLTSTDDHSFASFPNLRNLHLPSTLREIGSCTFEDCANLETINLPEGLEIIRDDAFAGCENLTNITIPSTCTIIEGYTFWHCFNVTINCNFSEKPDGWDDEWNIKDGSRNNKTYCPVNWLG